ncbi:MULTISPECIES: hypothetical protein [Prochlorococcus]|uniref:Josephin n=1 Tax=Prochlorococcus marinus (strain SARG / CCMP1375 / SS120) TaxID=167539 RepID=Q7VCM8_PROMA|nr:MULTISPECIES: hypothetical protein [Prochlorococcus]AAP99756.1 Predicted protein [Prochlorococcus marinus subsp. marinus str. CCMP1375]KGG14466.1 putative Josephin [Prochlorococcus marinus str. LG]KGG24387.1 putative Josephin [Prochlorococcus marinus str. SS35]KGG34159.1 putative Josephin [Prochlorococcus marinus str. SS51]KGG35798.1 putative Josephin [Prochlorococcus sp. SS52]
MTECQFLYLVNGEKQGEGFWRIGLTKNEDPLKEDKCFLECYRKELIGESAAKEILNAIEINLANLINDCISDGYFLETPSQGISYDLPLNILEEIYDFWLNLYKEKDLFEKVVGLLIIRRKMNFSHPAMIKGLKGFTGEWVKQIESLHRYRPPSKKTFNRQDPMWADSDQPLA